MPLGDTNYIGFDDEGYERRERLEAFAECPGCDDGSLREVRHPDCGLPERWLSGFRFGEAIMKDEALVASGVTAAQKAVSYLLRRIAKDADLRYLMLGTEAYALLCVAEKERTGIEIGGEVGIDPPPGTVDGIARLYRYAKLIECGFAETIRRAYGLIHMRLEGMTWPVNDAEKIDRALSELLSVIEDES